MSVVPPPAEGGRTASRELARVDKGTSDIGLGEVTGTVRIGLVIAPGEDMGALPRRPTVHSPSAWEAFISPLPVRHSRILPQVTPAHIRTSTKDSLTARYWRTMRLD